MITLPVTGFRMAKRAASTGFSIGNYLARKAVPIAETDTIDKYVERIENKGRNLDIVQKTRESDQEQNALEACVAESLAKFKPTKKMAATIDTADKATSSIGLVGDYLILMTGMYGYALNLASKGTEMAMKLPFMAYYAKKNPKKAAYKIPTWLALESLHFFPFVGKVLNFRNNYTNTVVKDIENHAEQLYRKKAGLMRESWSKRLWNKAKSYVKNPQQSPDPQPQPEPAFVNTEVNKMKNINEEEKRDEEKRKDTKDLMELLVKRCKGELSTEEAQTLDRLTNKYKDELNSPVKFYRGDLVPLPGKDPVASIPEEPIGIPCPLVDPENRLKAYMSREGFTKSAYADYMSRVRSDVPKGLEKVLNWGYSLYAGKTWWNNTEKFFENSKEIGDVVDKFAEEQGIHEATFGRGFGGKGPMNEVKGAYEFEIAGDKFYVIEFRSQGSQTYSKAHDMKPKKDGEHVVAPQVMVDIIADYKLVYDVRKGKVIDFHEKKTINKHKDYIIGSNATKPGRVYDAKPKAEPMMVPAQR
ncbi:hypothetical protein KY336_02435 [Candidatus Woesearchaeota archaeon]|nr:hypothetical protein [Candidatus Woesearchaeota archaeon]